jgi:hypothetical protein
VLQLSLRVCCCGCGCGCCCVCWVPAARQQVSTGRILKHPAHHAAPLAGHRRPPKRPLSRPAPPPPCEGIVCPLEPSAECLAIGECPADGCDDDGIWVSTQYVLKWKPGPSCCPEDPRPDGTSCNDGAGACRFGECVEGLFQCQRGTSVPAGYQYSGEAAGVTLADLYVPELACDAATHVGVAQASCEFEGGEFRYSGCDPRQMCIDAASGCPAGYRMDDSMEYSLCAGAACDLRGPPSDGQDLGLCCEELECTLDTFAGVPNGYVLNDSHPDVAPTTIPGEY